MKATKKHRQDNLVEVLCIACLVLSSSKCNHVATVVMLNIKIEMFYSGKYQGHVQYDNQKHFEFLMLALYTPQNRLGSAIER